MSQQTMTAKPRNLKQLTRFKKAHVYSMITLTLAQILLSIATLFIAKFSIVFTIALCVVFACLVLLHFTWAAWLPNADEKAQDHKILIGYCLSTFVLSIVILKEFPFGGFCFGLFQAGLIVLSITAYVRYDWTITLYSYGDYFFASPKLLRGHPGDFMLDGEKKKGVIW